MTQEKSIELRICSACKRKFPPTEVFFKIDTRKPLGLCSQCRKCANLASKKSALKARAKNARLSVRGYLKKMERERERRIWLKDKKQKFKEAEKKAKQQLKEKIKIYKWARKEAEKLGNFDYAFIQSLAEAKLKEIMGES